MRDEYNTLNGVITFIKEMRHVFSFRYTRNLVFSV